MQVKEQLDTAVGDLMWNIVELHSQFEEIHKSWAQLLGITEPQWLILMAVSELDEGRGISGTAVANKSRIHPAYVTTQTKHLEKLGFLTCENPSDGAGSLRVALTEDARTKLRKLSAKRQALSSTMLDGFDEEAVRHLNKRLNLIVKNSRLASQKLSIGIL
ncbi:transcriptional regulator [Bradyrhizobium sp. CCBAU 45394]|uniref:MarR family winged helix-turn-helix transcriptional regulator n=1 Tax=Bradyrhizobium sp. CCBAU 45394 TaxID=1325087 RepID=UPI0023043CBB|nr:MarR family transcriptional regulator [Bradyrhizobium sp. CCBAU 45394]MDA9390452.1 transcriptional regulator [Bradyrhizobium sp. CCBAU 45394]